MSINFGQIPNEKRSTQIIQFNNYKNLIVHTYHHYESQNQNYNEIQQEIIPLTLNYFTKYGFCFFFAIYSQQFRNTQEKHSIIQNDKIKEKQGKDSSFQNKKDNKLNKSEFFFEKLLSLIKCFLKNEKSQKKNAKDLQEFIQQTKVYLKQQQELLLQARQYKTEQDGLKQLIKILNQFQLCSSESNLSEKDQQMNERNKKLIEIWTSIKQQIVDVKKDIKAKLKKETFHECRQKILKVNTKNIFEQIFINRLKQILQKNYFKTFEQIRLCQAIFIRKQFKFMRQEDKFHEHKNYHWPIELPNILRHVRKTIVGFQNGSGGVIYVGMKESQKQVEASGISLTRKEVVQFFQWVHTQCSFIYPSFPLQEQEEMNRLFRKNLESLQRRQLEQKFEYYVTKYVSVEYISIVEPETYLDCYDGEGNQSKQNFLIKIKIKPGSKSETFHLLKQDKQGQIQCFIRQADRVNKLNLAGFFQLYNKRINQFMNEDFSSTNQKWDCSKNHSKS